MKTPRYLIAFIVFYLSTSVMANELRPNIIIILTDDQGYQDLGSFGSANIKTPNIDKMAAEGMKFTNFYAQTVCGPSRASLLTGSYPMRTERADHDPGVFSHPAMSLNEITIAEILKPLGYTTGMAGKWDLSGRRGGGKSGRVSTFNIDLRPDNQGFDYSFWSETSRAHLFRNGKENALKKPPLKDVTKIITDKAIEFIEKNKAAPFFFYLAHNMPHTPLAASEQFRGKSKDGLYGDVIEELDFHTGRLLKKVTELGLDDNTYIIFASDNGPWWIQGKNAGNAEPLRSAKTSTYEGGLRVPFIIKAPGKVPAGTTSDAVVATIDMMPTVATLTGAQIPADRVIDGIDIADIVHGKQTVLDRPFFYYQHQALRAVRQGNWKLHLPHSDLDKTKQGAEWQRHVPEQDRAYITELTLYNLKQDIGETSNVAAQYPKVVEQLLAQIEFAKKDIGYHHIIGANSRRKK